MRRHVLVARAGEPHAAIFAYASTKSREARIGAAFVHVDPQAVISSRRREIGFREQTYVYLARLVLAAPEDMLRLVGSLDEELAALKAQLFRALGIASGLDRLGWRGRIVHLRADYADYLGSSHAVIVTDPDYSRERRYQIVVPIFAEDEYDPEEWDVKVELAFPIGTRGRNALLSAPYLDTVFHPRDIEGWTGDTVDDETMERLDAALTKRFALP